LQQVHLAIKSLPKQLGGPSAAAFGPPSLCCYPKLRRG
jgi:hypothetical protein